MHRRFYGMLKLLAHFLKLIINLLYLQHFTRESAFRYIVLNIVQFLRFKKLQDKP